MDLVTSALRKMKPRNWGEWNPGGLKTHKSHPRRRLKGAAWRMWQEAGTPSICTVVPLPLTPMAMAVTNQVLKQLGTPPSPRDPGVSILPSPRGLGVSIPLSPWD